MSTPAAGFALDTSAGVDVRPSVPWPAWIAAGALIFLAAVAGVLFAPVGTTVAVWWPAAGLSVAFALLQPPRRGDGGGLSVELRLPAAPPPSD
ncbi:hypothetical protein [Agrococcus sp. Marseille-Q4369]|uniref:hypothetical protein n=1 Tax=Agrococcus sp. Marseille-Q4369 TaxID=2810513 RepID=UPI001B8AE190|nr:hypothetical protein [Agrococcus sp. Marseille-Q4369]QUW19481.1 hypothetical protein JSQ78_03970 [Agrococcus sp. Marseille-Q4369]